MKQIVILKKMSDLNPSFVEADSLDVKKNHKDLVDGLKDHLHYSGFFKEITAS